MSLGSWTCLKDIFVLCNMQLPAGIVREIYRLVEMIWLEEHNGKYKYAMDDVKIYYNKPRMYTDLHSYYSYFVFANMCGI